MRLPAGRMPGLLVPLVLAAVVSGCGGGDDSAEEVRQQGPQLSQPINLANCEDWNAATVDERLGTIRQLREFLGAPVPGTEGVGPVLDDEQAYDLFEGACEEHSARGYKLYKLYARAAPFAGE